MSQLYAERRVPGLGSPAHRPITGGAAPLLLKVLKEVVQVPDRVLAHRHRPRRDAQPVHLIQHRRLPAPVGPDEHGERREVNGHVREGLDVLELDLFEHPRILSAQAPRRPAEHP